MMSKEELISHHNSAIFWEVAYILVDLAIMQDLADTYFGLMNGSSKCAQKKS